MNTKYYHGTLHQLKQWDTGYRHDFDPIKYQGHFNTEIQAHIL